MIANYHTHTRWCHHGEGEIEAYIQKALEGNLQELAITEHVPQPGDFDPRRLQMDEFPAFHAELEKQIRKYRGSIRIFKGFECEYYPSSMEHYRRLRDVYGYELLILGQHTSIDRATDSFAIKTPRQLARYADEVCEALHTGMFAFLAHPDVVMCGYQKADEAMLGAMAQIFSTCEKLEIPVEINANGVHYHRGYAARPVWELAAKYRLKCLVSSDAHRPEDLLCSAVSWCEKMAREIGLEVLSLLPGLERQDAAENSGRV